MARATEQALRKDPTDENRPVYWTDAYVDVANAEVAKDVRAP